MTLPAVLTLHLQSNIKHCFLRYLWGLDELVPLYISTTARAMPGNSQQIGSTAGS